MSWCSILVAALGVSLRSSYPPANANRCRSSFSHVAVPNNTLHVPNKPSTESTRSFNTSLSANVYTKLRSEGGDGDVGDVLCRMDASM